MSRVRIARCPEHGLHGERQECFVCGGPVEQIEMVPVAEYETATRCWTRRGAENIRHHCFTQDGWMPTAVKIERSGRFWRRWVVRVWS